MATLPVFVSSTFRDFHRERDLLNSSILEELDERVAPYGCRVELVDLRWGITADSDDPDSRNATILDVCLGEIERSRPLFVGLIGERYGWRLPRERFASVADEAGLAGLPEELSITALEFEFGALQRPSEDSLFFQRTIVGKAPRELEGDGAAELESLKERVSEQCRVVGYEAVADENGEIDLAGFSAAVLDELGAVLERRARAERDDATDEVDAAVQLFLEDKIRGYAHRGTIESAVLNGLENSRSVVLVGESGMGKSSVWSTAVFALYSSRIPTVALPIAVTPQISTLRGVLERICTARGLPADPTLDMDQLEAHTLGALSDETPVILALDALDQLAGDPPLAFLTRLPENVIALVSTTSQAHERLLEVNGYASVPVDAPGAEHNEVAVRAICAAAGRTLPERCVATLASRAPNPLWLRMAVDDLHSLDRSDFAEVDPDGDPLDELANLLARRIDSTPTTTRGLVGTIIDRTRSRFGRDLVDDVLALTSISRTGLRPLDLEIALDVSSLSIALVRRALSPLIRLRGPGGRLGYPHAVIREAVSAHVAGVRSIPDVHRRLAEHLAAVNHDQSCIQDLLWHSCRTPGVGVASLLDSVQEQHAAGLGRVVADSVDAEYFAEAISGVSSPGISFLAWTAHQHKRSLPASEVITLALAIFETATEYASRTGFSAESMTSLGTAAGCLTDLPTATGHDLAEHARAARDYTGRLLHRVEGAGEAHAHTSMWFARECGDDDLAIQARTEAVDLWERDLRRNPSVLVQSWLQFALVELAVSQSRRGLQRDAIATYLRALPHAESVVEYHSGSLGARGNLVNIHSGLAEAHYALGDYPSARGYAIKGVEHAREQYTETPDRSSTRQYAIAGRVLALSLLQTGEAKAARDWMHFAESQLFDVARLDPTDDQWTYGIDTTGLAAVMDCLAGDSVSAAELARTRIAASADPETATERICGLLLTNAQQRRTLEAAIPFCRSIRAILGPEGGSGHQPFALHYLKALELETGALARAGRGQEAGPLLEEAIRTGKGLLGGKDRSHTGETLHQMTLLHLSRVGTSSERTRDSALSDLDSHLRELVQFVSSYPNALDREDGTFQFISKNLLRLGGSFLRVRGSALSAAIHYATALRMNDPTKPENVLNYCAVAEAIGTIHAKSGNLEKGAGYWTHAAQTCLDFTDFAALAPLARSILHNLAIASRDTSIPDDARSRCGHLARELQLRLA